MSTRVYYIHRSTNQPLAVPTDFRGKISPQWLPTQTPVPAQFITPDEAKRASWGTNEPKEQARQKAAIAG